MSDFKLIQTLAKEGLKFKNKKPSDDSAQNQNENQAQTAEDAAKKRWWEKWNLGANIGSNKQGVSKEKY